MTAPTERDREWDLLAGALNRYGINHVAPGARWSGSLPAAEELFRRLSVSSSVRLREATIPLLLTHPYLDADARRAIAGLDGDARIRAELRYCVACALQRMWWTRLQTDLGPRRRIEPAYLTELGLPSLDEEFGLATLVAICRREEAAYGHNAWAGYSSLMDHFLAEIQLRGWGVEHAIAG